MADSFREFRLQIDKEMQDLHDRVVELTRIIALDAYSSVKEKTPIDTGFARNSWFVDLGDGAFRSSNGGSDTTQQDVDRIKGSRPFQAITIANGAEYIGALEDGHSRQAPSGMVAVTISELESKYRRSD